MNPNREQPSDAFSSLDFAGFRSEFRVFYNEHHFVRCCWSNREHYCWSFFVGPFTRKLYAKSNAISDGSLFPHFGGHVFRFVPSFYQFDALRDIHKPNRMIRTKRSVFIPKSFNGGAAAQNWTAQRVIRYPLIIITPMTTCNNVSVRILFTFAEWMFILMCLFSITQCKHSASIIETSFGSLWKFWAAA